jgi:hypothetical protein
MSVNSPDYIASNDGMLIGSELECIYKEVVWPNLRYYPSIYLEGLKKSHKETCQGRWSLGQDMNDLAITFSCKEQFFSSSIL